jgi:hypothetical protein
MGARRRGLVAAACALCVAVSAAVAEGEVKSIGEFPVQFHGSIGPVKLPRNHMSPVRLIYGFKLPVRPGAPSLAGFKLELTRNFQIDTEAMPSCGVQDLSETTEAEAKRACGKSIVGNGFESAVQTGSSGEAIVVGAHFTLFNGRYQGGPAILAHGVLESEDRDFVEPAEISTNDSRFPTVLDFEPPPHGFPGTGAFRAIDLSLGRSHLRYLLAKCPLPREVDIGEFKMAHTTAEFTDGTMISGTAERPCKARG